MQNPPKFTKRDFCWFYQNGRCNYGDSCENIHCGKIQTFTRDYKNCTPAPFCPKFDYCPDKDTTCLNYHPGDEGKSNKVGQYHCTLRECKKGNLCYGDFWHPPIMNREKEVCRHWERKGYCDLGSQCNYGHPETKTENSPETKTENPPEKKVGFKQCIEVTPARSFSSITRGVNSNNSVLSTATTNFPPLEDTIIATSTSATTTAPISTAILDVSDIQEEISVTISSEPISLTNNKEKIPLVNIFEAELPNGTLLKIPYSNFGELVLIMREFNSS